MFLVTIEYKYSVEPTTIEACEARGFTMRASRRDNSLTMHRNGTMVGWLFSTQAEQIEFLTARGIIG